MNGTPAQWELITRGDGEHTERLVVPEGWLYRTVKAGGVALVFVPLPEYLNVAPRTASDANT